MRSQIYGKQKSNCDVTGQGEAQVFIVSKSYLTSNYPELIVKPLKEILENDDSFRVQLCHSTQIPFYDGLA